MANPKYDVWITDKEDTKSVSRVGVAFENEYGGLNIKLGPGVLIDARVRLTCYITLKPWGGGKAAAGRDARSDAHDAPERDQ